MLKKIDSKLPTSKEASIFYDAGSRRPMTSVMGSSQQFVG
jgi:hypothetical protein